MSEKKSSPFSDPRWNDTTKPKIVGYRAISTEDQEKYDKLAQKFLMKNGIVKEEK